MHILVLEVKIKVLVNLLSEIIILVKYLNYIDIFLLKFIVKFLKYRNNDYAIKLKKVNSYFTA